MRCGYRLDAATGAFTERAARPGSVSMCFNCGALAVFDERMELRQPTPEERLRIALDPQVIRLQIARAAHVSVDLTQR